MYPLRLQFQPGAKMKEPAYPNVRCDKHADEPGYGACIHVRSGGARVHSVERATPDSLGIIICQHCFDNGAPMCAMACVCATCCREMGWLFDKA